MDIPILRLPFTDRDCAELSDHLRRILLSGRLTMGPYTARFEELMAALAGTSTAVACNSGTSALELILRGLEIEGRSVVVPTNTFLATALAVTNTGNRVVFADSEPATLALDVDDAVARFDANTAAVIVVHIGGVITPRIDELAARCEERGIHLIEDCAHAHGCRWQGRLAGSFGIAGAFSFFPTKVLVTGEGGAVTTSHAELAERVRSLRNQGKDPSQDNHIALPGSNYRMSEVTAMIGVHQLEQADQLIAARRKIAACYDQMLSDIPKIEPLKLDDAMFSTYYKYVAFLQEDVDRAALKTRLRDVHSVSLTGEVYADPCHREPIWQDYTYCGRRRRPQPACHRWPSCGCQTTQRGYPGAEEIARRHICLPVYPSLEQVQAEHVGKSLLAELTTEGTQ